MSAKKTASNKNASEKNSSNGSKTLVAMMESPAFKKNPWAIYKWVLTKPIEKGEEESKQNAQDEVEQELLKMSQDFVPEFKWVINKDDITYRLKVKLKLVKPPSGDSSKSPQPPPPPPTFP